MNTLRSQMQADMVLRGLAPRTQQHYIAAVKGLAAHYNKRPDALSQQEVQCYLLHLIEQRKLAWSSTNQMACALRFFYHVTLARDDIGFIIPNRKVPAKLPEILSREEVQRILDACSNLRRKALLTTTYAAGLRVTETCALKVGDIDSGRMMLRVSGGKGGKDRYTLLSPALLELLRQYWRAARPTDWLFPSAGNGLALKTGVVQKVFYAAKQRAEVVKRGGIHSLRHAFATHLLEAGVDIHTIGTLMGHERIDTTARYLHLRAQVANTDSPLDLLSGLRTRH
jgi:integrase/recombinase XerD